MVDTGRSIGPVKVREVLDFVANPVATEWSPTEKEKLKQEQLFDERKPLEKIPFDFRLHWMDEDGAKHDSTFRAWEVSQTWRQYRRRYDSPAAVMREKWLTDVCGSDRDVSFFMGNTARFRQNFMVCGIYNPPRMETNHGTLW